jgi:hypothetical protein
MELTLADYVAHIRGELARKPRSMMLLGINKDNNPSDGHISVTWLSESEEHTDADYAALLGSFDTWALFAEGEDDSFRFLASEDLNQKQCDFFGIVWRDELARIRGLN